MRRGPLPAKPLRVEGREERVNLRAGPRLLRCAQAVQVAHGGECLPELVQTELPVAVPAARPKQRTARDSDTRRDRHTQRTRVLRSLSQPKTSSARQGRPVEPEKGSVQNNASRRF